MFLCLHPSLADGLQQLPMRQLRLLEMQHLLLLWLAGKLYMPKSVQLSRNKWNMPSLSLPLQGMYEQL